MNKNVGQPTASIVKPCYVRSKVRSTLFSSATEKKHPYGAAGGICLAA